MRYCIPSWTGDFRLDSDPDSPDRCILSTENPTADEMRQLGAFLKTAREKGWCKETDGVAELGASRLVLAAPTKEAAPVLAGACAPRAGQLTAVRSAGGIMTIDVDAATAIAKAPEEPETAVTVKKPTLCCPVPVEGPDVRSSAVLKAFCTPRQWRDWMEHGWLVAYGQITGHAYRIVHRHNPVARAQGKITWDLDDDAVIHCYDWTVPPAEEVLGIKLVLEHREPWIRNGSGALSFSLGPDGDLRSHDMDERFGNPLGSEGLDGTDSAGFLTSAGESARFIQAFPGADEDEQLMLGLLWGLRLTPGMLSLQDLNAMNKLAGLPSW